MSDDFDLDLDDLDDFLDNVTPTKKYFTEERSPREARQQDRLNPLGEPKYQLQTKTCLSCGTKFTGQQKYYERYEGDWLRTEIIMCPYCQPGNFDEIKIKLHNWWNFNLEEIKIKKESNHEN